MRRQLHTESIQRRSEGHISCTKEDIIQFPVSLGTCSSGDGQLLVPTLTIRQSYGVRWYISVTTTALQLHEADHDQLWLALDGSSYNLVSTVEFDGTDLARPWFSIYTAWLLSHVHSRNSISSVDICSRYVLDQNGIRMTIYFVTQRAGGNLRRDWKLRGVRHVLCPFIRIRTD